uniref:Ion_trans_2 domain-containing protein n=1 Tax=Haemonchus contortus TaxID=6289 RepID=A0A7I4YQ76_HAECO
MDPKVRKCVEKAVEGVRTRIDCNAYLIEHISIAEIDECYRNVEFPETGPNNLLPSVGSGKAGANKQRESTIEEEIEREVEKWSFGNALIFTFSVITTIGYGHIAPETFYGRLFCIFFGLIGVPLTLLTVADLGMFISMIMRQAVAKVQLPDSPPCDGALSTARDLKSSETEEDEEEGMSEDLGSRRTAEAVVLSVTFVSYLVLGAKVLSVYEPEMDFFNAFYFNFVTLTTIGLGDFVPRSFDYLYVTLLYIGVGLALTTMVIEMAGDLLRKLHYVGRKIDNMANTTVWFGGKKMTMKSLIKNLGDQFNVPEEELAKFDLNQFVENALKVEAGEMKTLRKQVSPLILGDKGAVTYRKLRNKSESEIHFVDERLGKNCDTVGDSVRTMETLPLVEARDCIDFQIPYLDFGCTNFIDSSVPTSFDDEYLRTLDTNRRRP